MYIVIQLAVVDCIDCSTDEYPFDVICLRPSNNTTTTIAPTTHAHPSTPPKPSANMSKNPEKDIEMHSPPNDEKNGDTAKNPEVDEVPQVEEESAIAKICKPVAQLFGCDGGEAMCASGDVLSLVHDDVSWKLLFNRLIFFFAEPRIFMFNPSLVLR